MDDHGGPAESRQIFFRPRHARCVSTKTHSTFQEFFPPASGLTSPQA